MDELTALLFELDNNQIEDFIIDTIRDPKSLAEGAMKRRQQERKEKLQSKPADAPERIQSLSAGFAKGGF